MVTRNKAQMPGINRLVCMVGKHPIMILREKEKGDFFAVNKQFPLTKHRLCPQFRPNRLFTGNQGSRIQPVSTVFLRDNKRIRCHRLKRKTGIHRIRKLFPHLIFLKAGKRKRKAN